MTLEQLSSTTVKVQLSESERAVFLQDSQCTDPNAPQMIRLMSFLLAKAELFCGIPFSQGQVSVEMLSAEDGGLIFYFSIVMPVQQNMEHKRGAASVTAEFLFHADLCGFCRQLIKHQGKVSSSALYQLQNRYILVMHIRGKEQRFVRHLLCEYGNAIELTPLLRAELTELGECLYPKHAVRRLAEADDTSA